ncbi:MAG TPA: hypothetical protein VGD41_17435, partial [Pyrinomonadaceae bacterium]
TENSTLWLKAKNTHLLWKRQFYDSGNNLRRRGRRRIVAIKSSGQCPLWVKSGLMQCSNACPLWANSGHSVIELLN